MRDTAVLALESPVAGSPAAAGLLSEIAEDPGRRYRIDVVGAGSHGKTVLLDAIADVFEAAGRRTWRHLGDDTPELRSGDVLVLDDAHQFPPSELERLAGIVHGPAGAMVVAHRSWPRPIGSAVLGAALAADRPPVVLDQLDWLGVSTRFERVVPRIPADLIDHVLTRTAGVPGLVDRLIEALARRPRPGAPVGGRLDDPSVAGLLSQLGYAIAAQDPDVRGLLLALAVGAPLDAEVLAPVLGIPSENPGALDEVVEMARAGGLLTSEGDAIPLVSEAVLALVPPTSRSEFRRSLAEVELSRGGNVLAAATGLIDTGSSGTRIAAVFAAGADEALRVGSAHAGELCDAAVLAGHPALGMAARRAEAALLADDMDTALKQADQVLASAAEVPVDDAARAGTVAAAVLARRGMLGRSAELYRWMGRVGRTPAAMAVPALIGTGALEEATALLHAATATDLDGPPTLLSSAEDLMAQGVHRSVTGSPTTALSELTQAAVLLESSHRAALLPDTAAALAALVALHCGELDVARSVLERAVRTCPGGDGAATRHRLLLGWVALQRGAGPAARQALTSSQGGAPLEPRDELLAATLEVALARRAGDLTWMLPAWRRAREAIVRHPVDLFVLQQLGELSVAATRMKEASWVRPHLDEAATLLDRLGNPPVWSAPLHWAGVQSAVLTESRGAAAAHTEALSAGAGATRYTAALAAAASQWVRLLESDIEAEAVVAASRSLHAVGLSWEGGKLAGQAAIRTNDRKAMSALLACARALQSDTSIRTARVNADPDDPADQPADSATLPGDEEQDGPLSGREREVGVLLLEGLTYKQIGERLFISSKTVEHHVARIRQRLGVQSREELFTHLRQVLAEA